MSTEKSGLTNSAMTQEQPVQQQQFPQPAPTQPPPYAYNPNYVTSQPGYYQTQYLPQNQPMVTEAPPDYMLQAILVTLFCFWPSGILAIMRASEAREAAARGDLLGAHIKAEASKRSIRISVIAGIVLMVALGVIFGVYFGVMNSYNYYD